MRILIAEDIPETLADLNDLALALFPSTEIVLAEDGDAAEAAIRDLIGRRLPLDIAILDTKLPYHGTTQDTFFLCCQIVAESRRTLVAHVTAYGNETDFREHLEQVHTSGFGERAFYLPKAGNWARELKQRLAAFKVDEDLEKLLEEGPERAAPHSCSSDLEMGQFSKEVERLWRYLPDPTRRRVQQYFTVESVDPKHVRVELGGVVNHNVPAFTPARLSWGQVLPLFERAESRQHGNVFRLHYFAETDLRPEVARHRVLTHRFRGHITDTAEVCFKALRWTADRLCRKPIRWEKPRVPIDVYLLDLTTQAIRPRPSTHRGSNTIIVRLNVAGGWPTDEWEVRWLGATAVHEMCHAMLLAQSQDSAWASDASLLWMSEGISVWLQAAYESGSLEQALSRDGEWLSYASRWIRETEAPLDWPAAACQAFMFFQYLTRSKTVEALHALSGAAVHSAWDVVSKVTGLAPDDVFADYAVSAYWLNERDGPCYAPAIGKRFGGICPSPSATLGPGERCRFSGEITAFGRRYYRIEPRGANRFLVERTDVGDERVTVIAGTATDDFRRIGHPMPVAGRQEILLDSAGHVFIVVAGRVLASSQPFAFEVAAR